MNINTNLVAEQYASMHDSELLAFAISERGKLGTEASLLLDKEMAKRGLLNSEETQNHIGDDAEMIEKKYVAALPLVYDMLESGESNAVIEGSLMELGFATEEVNIMLAALPIIANRKLKAAANDKLLGGLFASTGFAVSLLPFRPGTTPLVYILAWTTLLIGCLLFVRGWFSDSRFTKISKHIQPED